jgi:hypothetical protein
VYSRSRVLGVTAASSASKSTVYRTPPEESASSGCAICTGEALHICTIEVPFGQAGVRMSASSPGSACGNSHVQRLHAAWCDHLVRDRLDTMHPRSKRPAPRVLARPAFEV